MPSAVTRIWLLIMDFLGLWIIMFVYDIVMFLFFFFFFCSFRKCCSKAGAQRLTRRADLLCSEFNVYKIYNDYFREACDWGFVFLFFFFHENWLLLKKKKGLFLTTSQEIYLYLPVWRVKRRTRLERKFATPLNAWDEMKWTLLCNLK